MATTGSNRIIHEMEVRRIFEEMLDALEPWDMPILALRLEGIQSRDIARLLGIGRTTLYALDNELKDRIRRQVPEAWELIRDLRRRSGRPHLHDALERGWLDFGAPPDAGDCAGRPQSPDVTPRPPEKITRSIEPLPGADTPDTENKHQRSWDPNQPDASLPEPSLEEYRATRAANLERTRRRERPDDDGTDYDLQQREAADAQD